MVGIQVCPKCAREYSGGELVCKKCDILLTDPRHLSRLENIKKESEATKRKRYSSTKSYDWGFENPFKGLLGIIQRFFNHPDAQGLLFIIGMMILPILVVIVAVRILPMSVHIFAIIITSFIGGTAIIWKAAEFISEKIEPSERKYTGDSASEGFPREMLIVWIPASVLIIAFFIYLMMFAGTLGGELL